MADVNVRDIVFKVVWTAIAAGLAVAGAEIADLDAGWVPVATAGINAVLAWVRQRLGATPPPAPQVHRSGIT